MQPRWLLLALTLVVAASALPPVFIGMELRALLLPWLARPVRLADATIVEAELVADSGFTTQVRIALSGARSSGTGLVTFEHSPMSWLGGTSRWPGYVSANGHLDFDGSLFGGIYTPAAHPATVRAELAAGALAAVMWTVRLPAGHVRVHGAQVPLTAATISAKADMRLDADQPIPFTARIEGVTGTVDIVGTGAPSTGHWQLSARFDPALAHQIMRLILHAELEAANSRQPRPETISRLAARRLRSLLALGYLDERDGRFVTEASLDAEGLKVFGDPVALRLTADGITGKQP